MLFMFLGLPFHSRDRVPVAVESIFTYIRTRHNPIPGRQLCNTGH